MDRRITIGVVCLARRTYDFEAARGLYETVKRNLASSPDVHYLCIPDIVIEVEEAKNAAEILAKGALDGLAVITGTFHLGHLALILKKRLNVPTLLWGFPELPYNGGKIRLNAVCGLNLNASNLYKAGYDDFSCHVGSEIDPDFVAAVRMKAMLARAHIGLIGYRADGFFNLDVDEMALHRETGVLIDHYELVEVTALEAGEESVQEYREKLARCFDISGISSGQRELTAALCARFKAFMKDKALTALAVRCWPEFANLYGCAPCAAMSVLQSEGILLGCEGDIEGALSMLIAASLNEGTPFMADLSQLFHEDDTALLWHCGVAPTDLWDGSSERTLDTYFAAGRGVTAGFVLKSGPVSLVRIDSARGKTRLFYLEGEAVPMEKKLTGTYARVKFDMTVPQLLDKVTSCGVAHHLTLVYTQRKRAFTLFGKFMGYEVID